MTGSAQRSAVVLLDAENVFYGFNMLRSRTRTRRIAALKKWLAKSYAKVELDNPGDLREVGSLSYIKENPISGWRTYGKRGDPGVESTRDALEHNSMFKVIGVKSGPDAADRQLVDDLNGMVTIGLTPGTTIMIAGDDAYPVADGTIARLRDQEYPFVLLTGARPSRKLVAESRTQREANCELMELSNVLHADSGPWLPGNVARWERRRRQDDWLDRMVSDLVVAEIAVSDINGRTRALYRCWLGAVFDQVKKGASYQRAGDGGASGTRTQDLRKALAAEFLLNDKADAGLQRFAQEIDAALARQQNPISTLESLAGLDPELWRPQEWRDAFRWACASIQTLRALVNDRAMGRSEVPRLATERASAIKTFREGLEGRVARGSGFPSLLELAVENPGLFTGEADLDEVNIQWVARGVATALDDALICSTFTPYDVVAACYGEGLTFSETRRLAAAVQSRLAAGQHSG